MRLLFSPEQRRLLGMVSSKSVFDLRLEREVEVQPDANGWDIGKHTHLLRNDH